MALILAIESDERQAALVRRLVREEVRADLTLVDSKDAAIAAIEQRVPDLILVTALMSPRDEAELVAHLRAQRAPPHLQTLTIPLLAGPDAGASAPSGGLLTSLKRRRKRAAPPPTGCDPRVFAQEIVGYLERAEEARLSIETCREAEPSAAVAGIEPVVAVPEAGEAAAAASVAHDLGPATDAGLKPCATEEALDEAAVDTVLDPVASVLEVVEAVAAASMAHDLSPATDAGLKPCATEEAADEALVETIATAPVAHDFSRAMDAGLKPCATEEDPIAPAIPDDAVIPEAIDAAQIIDASEADATMTFVAVAPPVVVDGEIVEEERTIETAAPAEPASEDLWPQVEVVAEPIVEVLSPAVDVQADDWLQKALASLAEDLHPAVVDPPPAAPVVEAPAPLRRIARPSTSSGRMAVDGPAKAVRRSKGRKRHAKPSPEAETPRAFPLSMWVRANPAMAAQSVRPTDDRPLDALLRALKVPQAVAAVEYPRGCRIHRVRVGRRRRGARPPANAAPLIVISARLLGKNLRSDPPSP